MKKILGIFAIAALLSSVAFADVNVSASTEVSVGVMDVKVDTQAKENKAKITFFDQKNQQFDSLIGVSASGENVGVTAQIGVNMKGLNDVLMGIDPADKTNGIPATNDKGELISTGIGNIYVNNWYGWFTVAGFKLSAGNFNSRYSGGFLAKGAPNTNNISLLPYAWNMGVYGIKNVGNDGDQFTRGTGNTSRNRFATVGDYTFKFGDEMLVLAKAGITGIFGDEVAFGDGSAKHPAMKTGYAFQAVFQMPLLVVDALVRVPQSDKVSSSAFITLNPIKAMSMIVGATVGWEDKTSLAYGIDFGMRVGLSDNMSLTVQGNISSKDAGVYVKNRDSATKKANTTWGGNAGINWTMGINDVFGIFVEGVFLGDSTKSVGQQMRVGGQFGVKINPVSNAYVHASVQALGDLVTKGVSIGIPVALNFSF